jgi:hypothetical protein
VSEISSRLAITSQVSPGSAVVQIRPVVGMLPAGVVELPSLVELLPVVILLACLASSSAGVRPLNARRDSLNILDRSRAGISAFRSMTQPGAGAAKTVVNSTEMKKRDLW